MAEDVAVLRGRIQWITEGQAQVISQADAVRAKIEQVAQAAQTAEGQASGLQSRFAAIAPEMGRVTRELEIMQGQLVSDAAAVARLREEATTLAPSLQAASQGLQNARDESANLKASIESMGVSFDEINRKAAGAEVFLQSYGNHLDEAGKEAFRFKAIQEAIPPAIRENEAATKSIMEQIRRYMQIEEEGIETLERAVEAHKRLDAAEKRRISTERQLERTTERANKQLDAVILGPGRGRHLRGGGGGGGGPGGGGRPPDLPVTQTELTGISRFLLTGRVGFELLGRAIIRMRAVLGPMLTALKVGLPILLPLGAAAGAAAAAFKIMNSEIGKLSQGLSTLSPQLRDTVSTVAQLEGFDLSSAFGLVPKAANRLESFGATDGRNLAEAIARISEPAQFLFPGQGDAAQTFQAIQQAVEGVNFDPLRDAGLHVDRLNASLAQMTEQGLGKAEQRAFVLNTILQEVGDRLPEAAAQANREYTTLTSVMEAIKRTFLEIANNEQFVEAGRQFALALRDAVPSIVAVATFAANIATSVVRMAAQARSLFTDFAGQETTQLVEIDPTTRHLSLAERKARAEAEGIANEFDKFSDFDPFEGFEEGLEKAMDLLGSFKDDLGPTQRALEDFKQVANDRQFGFGIINGIQQMAVAFGQMEEDLNPRTAIAALQSFDSILAQVVERGTGQIDLLRLQAKALFEQGFINRGEFDAMTAGFDAVERVVEPIEVEAQAIRDRINEQAVATNGVTTGFNNAGASAAALNGQIATGIGLINEMAGAASSISFSGGGIPLPFGGHLGPRPGSPAAEQPHNVIDRERRQRGKSFSPEAARVEGNQLGLRADDRDALRDAEKLFEIGRFAPKSGGGAAAGADTGASIEEIRQLFRNINQLIKIGVNEGVFFSPAGNTIPRGGPNEFLNREGGVLVQTVNIRGIWDFADPAAKRQIIKELEEALAGLKKEVG